MRPHYFTLALYGITDDWGECRRLESTAEGEFWCGEPRRLFYGFIGSCERDVRPIVPCCIFVAKKAFFYNNL